MTNKEKFKILDGIKLANNIFPIDEQDCREENAAKIADMEKIFDLRDSWDYSCLFVLADFMADDDKVEAIKNNLIEENSYDRNQVSEPDWNTKLLVSTALEDNSLFFSMAFNWITLCEYRVSKTGVVPENQNIISDQNAWKAALEEPYEEKLQAAGKAGFKKFGSEHTIGKYGKIGQEGCTDKGQEGIIFYILLSEEYQNKVVSFNIEFTTLADGKEYNVVILNKKSADSKKKIQSGKTKADISKGIRVTKISVKE